MPPVFPHHVKDTVLWQPPCVSMTVLYEAVTLFGAPFQETSSSHATITNRWAETPHVIRVIHA